MKKTFLTGKVKKVCDFGCEGRKDGVAKQSIKASQEQSANDHCDQDFK